jgi:spore maturation protein CgeB
MRILFVGYLGRGQTSAMRSAALSRLGHEVSAVDAGELWRGASYLSRQWGQSVKRGRRIQKLNTAVVEAAARHRPQLVWFEKQEYLSPATVKYVQALGALTIHYNPDPYFSLSWKRTAAADACLQLYDVVISTKRYEVCAYRLHCHGRVIYSPLGYDPLGHAPPASRALSVDSDVVFVGGWEPRRERLLSAATEIAQNVVVWGYGWRLAQAARANPLRALRLGRLTPGRRTYFGPPSAPLSEAVRTGEGSNGEIYEEKYAAAIAGSRIALGFVREICPDEHTTRTFEIPAIGGFMLADRTEEHLSLFEEGTEAEYFGSNEEYLQKLKFYLSNETARTRIARAGHRRCMRSGYSYDDRIRTILGELHL